MHYLLYIKTISNNNTLLDKFFSGVGDTNMIILTSALKLFPTHLALVECFTSFSSVVFSY